VTRQDLSAGYQIAQSVHAATEFIFEHLHLAKQWKQDSNYIACLAAKDEEHLRSIASKLQSKGHSVSLFHEPDIDNQLTSIAVAPSEQARRMLSYLPLAGKVSGGLCKPKEGAGMAA
jgi:peptidyl-tRNA hydrolase